MIKNYFKIAFRSFRRHKVFTLINITGLSVGIAACLVIYLLVQHDFTFDKFEKDGSRIYRVVTNFNFEGTRAYNPGVSGPLPWAAKNQAPGLEVSASVFRLPLPDVFIPKTGSAPQKFKQQENVAFAEGSYFQLLQYKWLAGSPKTALNEPDRVVLTSDQAAIYFTGLPYDQVMGKTVTYDTIKTSVSGIVEPIKENTDFTFHDFISYQTAFAHMSWRMQLGLHNWGGHNPMRQFFIKLSPGASAAQVENELNATLKKNEVQRPGRTQRLALQPLSKIHFDARYGAITTWDTANVTALYYLLGIALFLLLCGCINFINLTTAQATQRAREIGVRKTMGSTRAQLIGQFLVETWLTTLFAVITAVMITPVILRLFSGFIPQGIKFDLLAQPGIILFLLALSVVVSLLSGFYPAIILSGYKPVMVLKNQVISGKGRSRNEWMRKSLIVTQFVIAQFFIIATVMVSKQIYYSVNKDLGFKKESILMIASPLKKIDPKANQVLLNQFGAIPQVEMVSMGYDVPSSDNTNSTEAHYNDGKKEITTEGLDEKFGDENYIKLYHIHLLAGRNLQPGDAGKAFLVNETYVQLLGFQNPQQAVGRNIEKFNGDTRMQIIGVVSDFHQESLHAPIAPLAIMTSTDKNFNSTFHIALKPGSGGNWHAAIAAMHRYWKQAYPNDDFEYRFVDEAIANLYGKEENTVTLLKWATGLSILISCLGLLGLAIFTTNQRTKEIGVRKILGATVAQIVALLSREIVWLVLFAFVIVVPLGWLALNKWMEGFADRTSISWWIFAGGGVLMLTTSIITSAFQTVKAAMANPVKSLRSE
ncbi:MAG TPA: FtsX-like permease family protein [Mucilaginibacter sp.]|jgi:predicted permease